jgi:Spy/CpxP family protein refolding chaperone
MTEQPNPSAGPQPPAQPAPRRRWPIIATVALAAALTGAAASHALSQGGFGHGPWGHSGFMGGGGFAHGRFDPAKAEDRADRMVRHLAIEIDATPQQQDKLRAIAKDAVKDLIPMREKAVAARERAHTLLTQPSVDRGAIESFRAEQIALADAASKRVAQALGDAAEALTPEQRRKIDEHLTARRAFWQRWHRG